MAKQPSKGGHPSAADAFVRMCGDWDTFVRFAKLAFPDSYEQIQGKNLLEAQNSIIDAAIAEICTALQNTQKWTQLSKSPGSLARELDDTLKLLRNTIVWRYGVPAHRQADYAERDKRIYDRRKRGQSFGQIRDAEGLSSEQAARQAYDRYVERQEKFLRFWFRIASGLANAKNKAQREKVLSNWLEHIRSERVPFE